MKRGRGSRASSAAAPYRVQLVRRRTWWEITGQIILALVLIVCLMVATATLVWTYLPREWKETRWKAMTTPQMAALLGLPADMGGFTVMKPPGGRGGTAFEHVIFCRNCGFPASAFQITYAPAPGPGWAAHDLKDYTPEPEDEEEILEDDPPEFPLPAGAPLVKSPKERLEYGKSERSPEKNPEG